jgi:hypothetical protein
MHETKKINEKNKIINTASIKPKQEGNKFMNGKVHNIYIDRFVKALTN